MVTLTEFLLASLLMGLGIGADVAVATLFRSELTRQARMRWFWVIGVSLTHTLFPMIGYLLTYFSIQLQPMITPVIGLVASGCIAYYLWECFIKADEEDQQQTLLVTVGLILAVSWDALWSGPAKSAQVINWPALYVWSSFVISGTVVFVMALVSSGMSRRLTSTFAQLKLVQLGEWLQCMIISYFGVLALCRYTFGWQNGIWLMLLVASAIATMLVKYKYAESAQRRVLTLSSSKAG